MAEYKIECEQFLGFSHSGSVTTSGESTIELSDEEVATLVQLIREKGTTDVGELGLETYGGNLHHLSRWADISCELLSGRRPS
jgi:hypothetical protein